MNEEWFDLRQAVANAAPDLDPPPQYWLESEPAISYCRECAIKARGAEFELGLLLRVPPFYARTDWEIAYFEGISSYADGCAGEGDCAEACYTCGVTLDYWLTGEGIKQELDHWADAEMSGNLSEIAYNIDRLFECSDDDRAEVEALARRFLAHAQRLARPDTPAQRPSGSASPTRS